MIPTLFGITLITFFVMKLAPGDPVKLKLMFAENIQPEALAAVLKDTAPAITLPEWYEKFCTGLALKMNGDSVAAKETRTYKNLHWVGENTIFYFKWLGNIMHFNFGVSSKDHRLVTDKILEALPFTLVLNLITITLVYLISVPIGMWSALHRDSMWDKIVMVKLFILYSLPGFWVASMLLIYLAGGEYLNLFPFGGFYSDDFSTLSFFGKVRDLAAHLFLPVLAETVGSFAFLARFSRSNFLDVIRQDYVRTARAKGLSENVVLYKHALRNALIPFVTMMGTLLPALIGGSVVVEKIFSIPGMGLLAFEAVDGRDQNVIMGISTIGAFLTLLGLLISDWLYSVVDPRIKVE